MDAKERIEALLKYSHMSASAFAKEIGAKTSQSIYELQKGNTRTISSSMQRLITSRFPEVNSVWLLTGEGEMLNAEEDIQLNSDYQQLELVPLIPIGAFAGEVQGFSVEGTLRQRCEMVVSPVAGCDIAIDVSGDSMEPEFPNGCRVFCKRIHEESFIAWGNVFVIDTCNGAFIKRVFPSEEDDDAVEARSINKMYPPFKIPKSSIYGMYRVLLMARGYSAS